MKNILIFKTDRLGDLLNISPIISNLKSNIPNSNITLICSKYNQSIAKYYHKDLDFFIYEKSLIFFLIKNIKLLFFKKYDLILQLDGKNHSYFSSILIRANKKVCIKYIKYKKIFGKFFKIIRPNFLFNLFFNYTEISYEDYKHVNNKNYHYLTLYLNLLKKLNININSKKHYLPFENATNISRFDKDYCLIHIDKRWELFPNSVKNNLKEKIFLLSKNNKIIITSNVGGNEVFKFLKNELINKPNIEIIDSPNLHDTISLVYFSNTCISSHSGLIVHSAAAFNKKVVDIVPEDIFNELDRWVPYDIHYKRLDINNFVNEPFDI